MPTINDVITDINELRLSPDLLFNYYADLVERINTGEPIDYTNPNNAWAYLAEVIVTSCAANAEYNDTQMRALYPRLATTREDLYRHMSDEDYGNSMFATPASTTIHIMLSREEFLRRAVAVPNSTIRQLVIPRHTTVRVNEVPFTMQYPLEIRLLPQGSLIVGYDTSIPSPIKTLTANTGLYSFIRLGANSPVYIDLAIEMDQFEIASHTMDITASNGLTATFDFDDQFYYCRVYSYNSTTASWSNELHTTHSEVVYDRREPTAVLTVLDGQLKVTLPQLYFRQGTLPTQLKVDIYTTRGPISMALEDYATGEFSVEFKDGITPSSQTYWSPIEAFNDKAVYSTSLVDGGTNGLSFEELQTLVVNSSTRTTLPITDVHLRSGVSRLGYDLYLLKDTITSRIYRATRALPDIDSALSISGAAAAMLPYQSTLDALTQFPTVYDNGSRLTISSDTLFELVNGALRIVPQFEVDQLMAMDPPDRANALNGRDFLITPYYYVIDTSLDVLEARAYYTSHPYISSRGFLADNSTTLLQVESQDISLTQISTGYRLLVTVSSDANYKDIADDDLHCQMAFIPDGESSYAYVNGVLAGEADGERVWQFDIETSYDITANDVMMVYNFVMHREDPITLGMPLTVRMHFLYSVTDYSVLGMASSDIDAILGQIILPENTIGLTHDMADIVFSVPLPKLWTNIKPAVTEIQYQQYDEDVLMYALEDEIEYRSDGTPVINVDPDTGAAGFSYLYRNGDPVYEDDGVTQKIRHHAGDLVRDSENNPIPIATRDMLMIVDLFLYDGLYAFTTSDSDLTYRQSVADTVLDYCNEDMVSLQSQLLEQTLIYYSPKTTLGAMRVLIENGRIIAMPSRIQFKVDYYLTSVNHQDTDLRERLTTVTRTTLHQMLQRETVSLPAIQMQIKEDMGDRIIDVVVHPIGNDEISIYTSVDNASRGGVRRKLTVTPDGVLEVEDDILIRFIRHTESTDQN